jgi:hypothetical protein
MRGTEDKRNRKASGFPILVQAIQASTSAHLQLGPARPRPARPENPLLSPPCAVRLE